MSPLEQRVAALEAQLKALTSNTTIPFNVEKAFHRRLRLDGLPNIQESNTNPLDQVVTVDEAGVATHVVQAGSDTLLRVVIDNVAYDVPAYNT